MNKRMRYWLMKSEPEDFSIDDLERVRPRVALAGLLRHGRQAVLFRSPIPGKAFFPVAVHRVRTAILECIEERPDIRMDLQICAAVATEECGISVDLDHLSVRADRFAEL